MAGFVVGIVRLRPDVVHAHDAAMLAPGFVGARLTRARLLYDSHELATGVPYRTPLWARLVWALERMLIRRCDAVITVSDGIADRLRRLYGLRERPTVVRNLPDLPNSGPGGLRRRLGLSDEPLVLHQGAPAPHRGCEELVLAMEHVPDAHLVFLGESGFPVFTDRLARRARERSVAGRIHFTANLPLEALLSHTREADVGVSLLEGNCENHRLALPNKVFEYVAAGVPVVVSDLPELSRLVHEHGLGWTADPGDPSSIAAALREALTHGHQRTEALQQAAGTLNWEREKGRLIDVYSRLAGQAR
jgi:glycosyltransferase involved in cell wall biosynthesis